MATRTKAAQANTPPVVLYSNDCPMCIWVKDELRKKKIPYTINGDMEFITKLGFTTVPVLFTGEGYLTTKQIWDWLDTQGVSK